MTHRPDCSECPTQYFFINILSLFILSFQVSFISLSATVIKFSKIIIYQRIINLNKYWLHVKDQLITFYNREESIIFVVGLPCVIWSVLYECINKINVAFTNYYFIVFLEINHLNRYSLNIECFCSHNILERINLV